MTSPLAGAGMMRTFSTHQYRVVYSFGTSLNDAENPDAPLLSFNGMLYGTTVNGGEHGDGAVFMMTRTGKESLLYSFNGPAGDGENPIAGLTDVSGTLYGTTEWGGAKAKGTVFSVTTSGKEKVLHSFSGGADGEEPFAGSLIYVNGTLYGTTYEGGSGKCPPYKGCGTVFAITTAGKETVIHNFAGYPDGSVPESGLIAYDGSLYGTTQSGGKNGYGTVYRVTKSGKEIVIHSFGGAGDGTYPEAGLVGVSNPKGGALYGTTSDGGAYDAGTVFKLTTSGKETILHSFGSNGDGAYPTAKLLNVKGTLYGTTLNSGFSGTIFAITTAGMETILHTFGGAGDGSHPFAALANVNGALFGTTDYGGANCVSRYGCGTAYSLTL